MTEKENYINWLQTNKEPIKSVPNYISGINNIEIALGLSADSLFSENDLSVLRKIALQYEKHPKRHKDFSSHLQKLLTFKNAELIKRKGYSNNYQNNDEDTSNEINHEQRASFAWPILTEYAGKRTTISYGDLAKKLNIHHRAIRFILGVIQNHCLDNRLPPLTILVLNKSTGLPGDGFIAWDVENSKDGLEKVYNFDWTKLQNPFSYAQEGATQYELVQEILQSPSTSETTYTKVKVRGVVQKVFREALLNVYD